MCQFEQERSLRKLLGVWPSSALTLLGAGGQAGAPQRSAPRSPRPADRVLAVWLLDTPSRGNSGQVAEEEHSQV